mmetsp:Transcript_12627/g.15911  ORF Transcript_12627/g.15911 Transcript_12627/m.15911 type:complete len:703 (-) Transcript_12627:172-2280(-)|eukprot:CAMPEP_0172503826 /NCGR_PEP_ID=MMETSP1066-20121228/172664_1 /TAXON_ID=671091 /ORGANISM="Coscinodiscus wailesii, Strain CCMP2513" /LENGTH=702 /DNA_ID=CAMNT_0013279723 /DNA_START=169 /DNA_END=2277 /DNA_ORIENTATION=+
MNLPPPDNGGHSGVNVLRQSLKELTNTIRQRERRLFALKALMIEIDHDDQRRHDIELNEHTDRVLFQKLALAFAIDDSSEEVSLICSALEVLYRASRSRMVKAFSETGVHILPLLKRIIEKPYVKKDIAYGMAFEEEEKKSDDNSLRDGGEEKESGTGENGSAAIDDNESEVTDIEIKPNDKVKNALNSEPVTKSVMGRTSSGRNFKLEMTQKLSKSSSGRDFTETTYTKTIAGDGPSTIEEVNGDDTNYDDTQGNVEEVFGDNNSAASEDDEVLPERRGSGLEASEGYSSAFSGDDFTEVDEDRPSEDNKSKFSATKILQVLRVYSRVLSAMKPIARHPGMLDAFLYQLQLYKSKKKLANLDPENAEGAEEDYDYDIMDTRTNVRVNIIAILVNLACAEENKALMANHPKLLDDIIDITVNDPSTDAREHAIIVIMNLSYADANKSIMLQNKKLLPALTDIFKSDTTSLKSRHYATSTIHAFSTPANVSNAICTNNVLECLTQIIVENSDEEHDSRFNAVETLLNLSMCESHDAVKKMASHENLLVALAVNVNTDAHPEIRLRSAQTIQSVAGTIHHPDPSHPELLNAIIKASDFTKNACIADAIKVQAEQPANRKSIGSHPEMLDILVKLCGASDIFERNVKVASLSALNFLCHEEHVKDLISNHQGVMRVLTFNATTEDDEFFDEDCHEIANSALTALM